MRRRRLAVHFESIAILIAAAPAFAFPSFKEHVINPDAEVVYAVDVADMNGDKKPDIIGLSATHVTWYENPIWAPHRIANQLEKDNVCIAPCDIDGDGIPELAVGADWQPGNTDGGGKLYFLKQTSDPSALWNVTLLVDEFPTLHRIRWADTDGDGKNELVVSQLKGKGSKAPAFDDPRARLILLRPPADPSTTPWASETIDESLHIVHNIWPHREGPQTKDSILTASMEGVWRFVRDDAGKWTATDWIAALRGAPYDGPGAGEVKTASNIPMFAAIEPWHGENVVVYVPRDDTKMASVWYRHVLDDSYKGGHAVGWADFDRDGADDVLAGYREKSGPRNTYGLYVYALKLDRATGQVQAEKHAIDEGGMATEDAVAADLNGDGWPDIVAGGRATHNIKYYENLGTGR